MQTLTENTLKHSKKASISEIKSDSRKVVLTKNPLAAARMANNFVLGLGAKGSQSTNELKVVPQPLRKQASLHFGSTKASPAAPQKK